MMRQKMKYGAAILAAALLWPVAQAETPPADAAQTLLKTAQSLFQALPSREEMEKIRPFTDAQVKLGHQLWYEPRL